MTDSGRSDPRLPVASAPFSGPFLLFSSALQRIDSRNSVATRLLSAAEALSL